MTRGPTGRRRGEITSYGEGRVCAEPDCRTTLSRYNSNSACARHSQPASGFHSGP